MADNNIIPLYKVVKAAKTSFQKLSSWKGYQDDGGGENMCGIRVWKMHVQRMHNSPLVQK
jgi:hypothetical protein